MKALLIGSIGVVTETSNIQRQAYNQAMKEVGLDWHWDLETYQHLLGFSGGIARLELLAAATNQELNDSTVEKIHTRKTEVACQMIKEKSVQPRPGIVDLVNQARERGLDVFWVTSTGTENTSAILESADTLSSEHFKQIYLRDDVEAGKGKPSADIYNKVLSDHNLTAEDVIAVEDSLPSVLSAKRAGIKTYAYQGELHTDSLDGIADGICKTAEDLLKLIN